MDAFIFQAAGDFSQFERGAQSAWDRAQGYVNKRPIRLKIDDQASQPLGRISAGLNNFDRALDASTKRVLAFGITAQVFAKLEQGVSAFVRSTISVQDALVRINVGLNQNQKGLENFKSTLFNIARDTGQNFDDTAKAAERLSKQNLGVAETTKRLKDVMTLARLAGIDSVEAFNAMNSTLATFKKEGLTSAEVLDRLTVGNNKFGVSAEVFTEAIQRSGLVAQQAGVNFNQLLGIITAVQRITGRDGAAVGTSLNKVLAGLEKPETREKLNSYGIAVKNNQGGQLPAFDILQNLANKRASGKLSQNDQANIFETVSGQRQEENLIAVLDELAKKYNLVTQSIKGYNNATGAGKNANEKRNESVKDLLTSLGNTATQFASNIGERSFAPSIKATVSNIDNIRKLLSPKNEQTGEGSKIGGEIGEGIIKGISNVLSGPGAALIGKILFKGISRAVSFGAADLKSLLGINKESQTRAEIQARINSLLKNANQEELASVQNSTTLLGRKNALLAIQIRINEAEAKRTAVGGAISGMMTKGNLKTMGFAGGYMPAVMNEMSDISRGVGGASSGARPISIPNFNFGNGHIGSVVANSDEYLVPNFAGGGDAIFNRNMVAKYGVPGGAKHLAGGYVPNKAGGDDVYPYLRKLIDLNPNLTEKNMSDFLRESRGKNDKEINKLINYYSLLGKPMFPNMGNPFQGLADATSGRSPTNKPISTAGIPGSTYNARRNSKGGSLDSREAAIREAGFNASSSELYNLPNTLAKGPINTKQRETLQRIMVEYGESTKVGNALQRQLNKGLEKASKFLSEDSLEQTRRIIQRSKESSGIYGTYVPGDENNATAQQKTSLKTDIGQALDLGRSTRTNRRRAIKQAEKEADELYAQQQKREKNGNKALGVALALPFLAGFLPEGDQDTTKGKVSGAIGGAINYGSAGFALAGPVGGITAALGGALIGYLEKSSKSVDQLTDELDKGNDLANKFALGEDRGSALKLNGDILNQVISGDRSSGNLSYLQSAVKSNSNKDVNGLTVTQDNAESIANALRKSVNIIANSIKAAKDEVADSKFNESQRGRTFLGPKDFLNYNEKSSEGFGAAGAASRFSNFDTSRNGFLTATQRARSNLGFFDTLEEQLPGTDLSSNIDLIRNRHVVQRSNALSAAADYLSSASPGGRYRDFRGEPITQAVEQGLAFKGQSISPDIRGQVDVLSDAVKRSEISSSNYRLAYTGKSNINTINGRPYVNGAGAGITYNGPSNAQNHNYIGNQEKILDQKFNLQSKLNIDPISGGKFKLDQDTQNLINKFVEAANTTKQQIAEKDRVIELRVTYPKNQGYGSEGANGGNGDNAIGFIFDQLQKLAAEVNKLKGRPVPPGQRAQDKVGFTLF